jgi:hypothetical protein
VRLADAVTSVTGIGCEPLGWLASDVKNHQEDPDFYDVHAPPTAYDTTLTYHLSITRNNGSLGK